MLAASELGVILINSMTMRKVVLALCALTWLNAAETRQLFNGKDLSGWEMVGHGRFVVENGLLKTEGGMGLLHYTGQKFGNQIIRVVFKTASPRANSGVYIRMPEQAPDPWYGVHNGFEVQIDSAGDEWHRTGSIYSLSRSTKLAQKPNGEWNTMDIELAGPVTRVTLNGEVVNTYDPKSAVPERTKHYEPMRGPRPVYGYIGLQNHDPDSIVFFREISVIDAGATLSKSDRDQIMSYYHSTRKQVMDAVEGLSDAQANFRPAPGKWTIAEVLEHLTLVEPGLAGFAIQSVQNPGAQKGKSPVKDEQVIAQMSDRSNPAQAPEMFKPSGKWPSREALLEEFKTRRDQNIRWLWETRDDLRGTIVKFGTGPLDGYQALLMVPAHTERHLKQVTEIKAAPEYPKR